MRKEENYIQNGITMPIHCEFYHRQRDNPHLPPDIHYHKYCEIVLCLEGICNCIIGTKKYILTKGDVLFIDSNEPHATGFFTDLTQYIVIKFIPSILFASEQTPSEYSYLHLLHKTEHHRIYFKSDEIKDIPFLILFNKALSESNKKDFGYEFALRAYVIELFLHIIRIWKNDSPEIVATSISNSNECILQRAIEYIELNFANLSQTDCARAIGVSVSHLSRIFKNGLNTSFSKFVNSVKLRESEKLLLTTSMSITEIGDVCGFSTTSYFIALFKEKHNLTPIKYRNSIKQN